MSNFFDGIIARTQNVIKTLKDNPNLAQANKNAKDAAAATSATAQQNGQNVLIDKQDRFWFDLHTKIPTSMEPPKVYRMSAAMADHGIPTRNNNNFINKINKNGKMPELNFDFSPPVPDINLPEFDDSPAKPPSNAMDLIKLIDEQMKLEEAENNKKNVVATKPEEPKLDTDALQSEGAQVDNLQPKDKVSINNKTNVKGNIKNTSKTVKQEAAKIGKDIAKAGKDAEAKAKNNQGKSTSKPKKKTKGVS